MHILCIGNILLEFPEDERSLRVIKERTRILPNGTVFQFVDAPPYVVFDVDEKGTAVDACVLNGIELCRFENGHVVAVPWLHVMKWLQLATDDRGKLFLSRLTLGTMVKTLTARSAKRRKGEVPVVGRTFTCGHEMHLTGGTSRTVPRALLDEEHFNLTWQTWCQRCNRSSRLSSGDGFLNLVTARPLLLHMERDERYNGVLDMLLGLSRLTRTALGFYRFGDLRLGKVPADFELSLKALFHDSRLVLKRILATTKRCYRLFGMSRSGELDMALEGALKFRLFGEARFLSGCPLALSLQGLCVAKREPFSVAELERVEVVAVSVMAPERVMEIFRSSTRRAVFYVHLFALPEGRLSVPGVESLSVLDMSEELGELDARATVVVWPAHMFTVGELERVKNRCLVTGQPLILAGTAFVVPERDLFGLAFTELIVAKTGHVFLGPSLNGPLAHFLERLEVDISCEHPLLPRGRTLLSCPVYVHKNGRLFYDRVVLISQLASLFPSASVKNPLKYIMFVPGPEQHRSSLARARLDRFTAPVFGLLNGPTRSRRAGGKGESRKRADRRVGGGADG